ncbi:MAG: DUF1624 domain-containing protein [Vicinamibacteria bacterium]|nr:DUF1624 domain-containing protein [Vicinamibacteria bacterium]
MSQPSTQAVHHKPHNREVYIDAFRGLMALAMVQGHVCDTLLSTQARLDPWYQLQSIFHGSTAPGFLFASGFVAGLPRAPLSLKASIRRARRLLFVFCTGYFLHLPYFSLWKTWLATPQEKAVLFACDALQVIAATQMLVIVLQWIAGIRWPFLGGALGALVLAVSPWIWAAKIAKRFHPALGAYFDASSGSHFPFFPFAAFVLAGTIAGALIGRQQDVVRRKRSACTREWFWVGPLALLGHETLLVFVLHLMLLYGGVMVASPLTVWIGQLGFAATFAVLLAMLPILFAAAWTWHRFKVRAPHEATLTLVFIGTFVAFEFLTRGW